MRNSMRSESSSLILQVVERTRALSNALDPSFSAVLGDGDPVLKAGTLAQTYLTWVFRDVAQNASKL